MIGEDGAIEFCSECCKPLKPDEIYLFNGKAYCIICINIASARSY